MSQQLIHMLLQAQCKLDLYMFLLHILSHCIHVAMLKDVLHNPCLTRWLQEAIAKKSLVWFKIEHGNTR